MEFVIGGKSYSGWKLWAILAADAVLDIVAIVAIVKLFN